MEQDTSMKKIKATFDEFDKIISDMSAKFDETQCDLDNFFSELVDELKTKNPEGKSLTKKQRKEMALKMLKEKFPNIVKIFDEFDLLVDGIKYQLEDKLDKLSDLQDKMEEIEELQDEVESKKQELDF